MNSTPWPPRESPGTAVTAPALSASFTDVFGLRHSGIFPSGREPSIATLRAWTKCRRIPAHKVGHFVYYDPAEVAAHIRSKLKLPADEFAIATVRHSAAVRKVQPLPPLRWSPRSRPCKISEFRNPSGAIVFCVYANLDGVRVRRNFRTRAEAEIERQRLEIQRLDLSHQFRAVLTRLSAEQVREAEAAFRLLEDRLEHPQPLLFYLEQALARQITPGFRTQLKEAVAAYLVAKTREHERAVLSVAQLGTITRAMKALCSFFPDQPVSQFTGEQLLPFLDQGEPTLKTYNNRRSLVFNFFKHAVRHGWSAENPVEKTPYYRVHHRRGSAQTMTADRAAALMAFLETYAGGALVPYFALCLFAGVRPCFKTGEISKLRPESVRLDTGAIHIEPDVSKVKMKRVVTLQPNLAAWLSAYPLSRYPIRPLNLPHLHRAVFTKFVLSHDILRHTFISMFVAKFRSVGEAALQAGNSEDVIRKFYLDLKSPAEGERFFAIVPQCRPKIAGVERTGDC